MDKLRAEDKLRAVNPTEQQMRDYFEMRKDRDSVPALVSLQQVVVEPHPSLDARVRARGIADSLARELRAGADFATAARRFATKTARMLISISILEIPKCVGGTTGLWRVGCCRCAPAPRLRRKRLSLTRLNCSLC